MFLTTVRQADSLGFAVMMRLTALLNRLLPRLPGWTIAGVVTSGTVEAKTAGMEEAISGDGPEEAISGDGPEEAAATTTAGMEEAISGDGAEGIYGATTTGGGQVRTMTGVAMNRKFLTCYISSSCHRVHPYLLPPHSTN